MTGAYEGLTPEFVEALVRKMPSDPSLAHIGMETWLALAWDKSPFGEQLQGASGEKAAVYQQLAELNRQIRQERKNLALCREIMDWIPQMEKTIQSADELKKEVERDEHRRR